MYLHLGQDVVVRKCDIIGVFDMDNASASYLTRDFLARAERESRITEVSEGLPRSFVVTDEDAPRVYLSQISSQTLLRRFEERDLELKKPMPERQG